MTLRCEYKKFTKIKLCPADLDKFITIGKREFQGDHPDDLDQEITSITTLQNLYAACDTVKPTRPVQLLNTNVAISHIFYVRYADLHVVIDVTEHLLRCGELYRIEEVEDLGGYHETVALYCRKAGDEPEGRS